MPWIIKTHDGKELTIRQNDETIIKELAKRLELVPVTMEDGTIKYIKPSSVSRLEYIPRTDLSVETEKLISAPDYRGTESPSKEKLRQMLNDKSLL